MLLLRTCASIACIVLSVAVTSAQALYPVSMDQKVKNSTLIVEGKVVSKSSFWNDSHNMILTSNKVLVYKIFKGYLSADTISIVTQGGSVGKEFIGVSELLQLKNGDEGIFFCRNGSAFRTTLPGNAVDVYSSAQGFIKYDALGETASVAFSTYQNIEKILYKEITSRTGVSYRVINTISLNRRSLRETATPSITSFSPSTVRAGATEDQANNLLTITGTNFGPASGSAGVLFDDADDGTGNNFYLVPFNDPLMVSWTNTVIKVRVPSNAGTGVFKVVESSGTQTGTSSTSLNVQYSITAARFINNVPHIDTTKQLDLINANGLGGYSFSFSTSTAGGGKDITAGPEKQTVQRALTTWKELAGYNITEDATTTSQVVSRYDDVNIILYDNTNTSEPVLPAGVLGLCYYYGSICDTVFGTAAFMDGFDIIIRNEPVSAGSAPFTAGPCPPYVSSSDFMNTDLESVILHELGHAMGLAHVNQTFVGPGLPQINPGALMNYAIPNGVKRTSPDASALRAGLYQTTPRANNFGGCVIGQMTQLTRTVESKDECPTFPSSTVNSTVAFDLNHATSNLATDPQANALNCNNTVTGVTNTAFYAYKEGSSATSLFLNVTGYSTTPASQAACANGGVELAVYAVSSCPAGQAFPQPIACRTFKGNGGLTTISGLTPNATYLIVADGIENTKASFSLAVSSPTLPISLTNFSGQVKTEGNQIDWKADYATNIDKLILEKSIDGINYNSLYIISSQNEMLKGNYEDRQPFAKTWYRLRIEHEGGRKEYSSQVILTRENMAGISIGPNPSEGNIRIQFNHPVSGEYSVKIYNQIGQNVYVKERLNTQTLDVDLKSKSAGLYQVHIYQGKNLILSTPVVLK